MAWGTDGVVRELRAAVRGWRGNLLSTAVIVVTLALGVGANAVIFGVVDRVLWSPPPGIPHAEDLARLWLERTDRSGRSYLMETTSYPAFERLRGGAPGLTGVAAGAVVEKVLGRGDAARNVPVALVSDNYFDVLGVDPWRGRGFDRSGATDRAVVVSHRFWLRDLGGVDDALGAAIQLDGEAYTIVGIAPPGFRGHDFAAQDLWAPILAGMTGQPPGWHHESRMRIVSLVGRMEPGHDLQAVGEAATASLGGEERVVPGSLLPGSGPNGSSPLGRLAFWLGGVAVVVFLVSTTNVIGLELLRAFRAKRENAVRLALGIGRARLARSLVVESLVLTGVAAAIGLWVAATFGPALQRQLLPGLGGGADAPDGRVLAACAALALIAGLVSGAVRFAQALDPRGLEALRAAAGTSTFRRSKVQRALLVAQTALALVLLIGAGLFSGSLRQILDEDLGFDVDHVALVRLQFQGDPSREVRRGAYGELSRTLAGVPGVEATASVLSVPFGPHVIPPIDIPGRDMASYDKQLPFAYPVTPDYFRIMGIEPREGRLFTPGDDATAARVVIVNEAMAREFWPGERAVGRCLRVGFDAGDPSKDVSSTRPCREIVGIVGDSRIRRVRADEEPTAQQFYLPWEQVDFLHGMEKPSPWGLVLRTRRSARAQQPDLLRAVLGRLPAGTFADVQPYQRLIDPQIEDVRVGVGVFRLFGSIALALAAFGLYGSLAYAVAQRRREMAVRVALGARARSILALVARDGLRPVLLGAILGLALSAAGVRWISAYLYRTGATDPRALTWALGALLGTALLACSLPALRAARTDPASSLRDE